MTEALAAFIDMVLRVTALPEIEALPRALDPSSRLLLQRLGFGLAGAMTIESPISSRFCLDRATWRRQNAPTFRAPAATAPGPSLAMGCA